MNRTLAFLPLAALLALGLHEHRRDLAQLVDRRRTAGVAT